MLNKKNTIYIVGVIVFFALFYFLFLSAPGDFPSGTVVRIEEGSSLRGVSFKLQNEHIIRSRTLFEAFVIIFGNEEHVISTNYYFENKLPVFVVARRISKGEHDMAPVSVTIPEGFNVKQIAEAMSANLLNFNKAKFLLQAKNKEGYLFPDTYFFLTTGTEEDVIKSMSDNFEKKIKPFISEIISLGKSEKDIITMASIIEKESRGNVDREVISGILWKRFKIGMALQVDAAPETYRTKGLPRSPIGNPGILAIEAAIHPQSSPYLYYLHDKNGNIHYARNFTEHTKNIQKYLSR